MSMVWSPTVTAVAIFPASSVLAAVLTAMVLHAAWNAWAKAMQDQVVAFFLIAAGSLVAGLVFLVVAPLPAGAAVPFLLASIAIHELYNTTLLNSYRFGDLAQTYPLARGVAPLLVAVVAFVVANEAPNHQQLIGLAVICGGLASLATVPHDGRSDRRAVVLALVTGAAIAAYTVVDGLGVRRSGSVLGYSGLLFVGDEGLLLVGLALVRGRSILPAAWRLRYAGMAAALASAAAYTLVLWAQTRTALATVSALRETSVVAGAVMGTVLLHEGHARRRITAAVVVAVGVALLVVPW